MSETGSGDLQRIQAAFESFQSGDVVRGSELAALYDDDIYFQDPIQRVRGREAIIEVLESMSRKLQDIRFEVLHGEQVGERVYMTWEMSFRPPFGPRMTIEGVTDARVRDGKIVEQRDYWDLLGASMDSLPLAAPVYRRLVKLLG